MATPDQLRVHQITLKDAGAFRDFTIDLGGRHILIYGDNGSGKTSLARLMRTWVWSASVNDSSKVHALFSRGVGGNMVNLKAVAEAGQAASVPALITVELRGMPATAARTYTLSANDHETCAVPPLQKSDMASDFINYRVFYEMFRGRPQQPLDLWSVFLAEILPFCAATDPMHPNMAEYWEALDSADPVQQARLAGAPRQGYRTYYKRHDDELESFEVALRAHVATIAQYANRFYKKHFAPKTGAIHEIELAAEVPRFDRSLKRTPAPLIHIAVKLGTQRIPDFHTVLNEAELTKLAISIRLGATKANMLTCPLKLLVLDDILISLDMSNRLKTIEIILDDAEFAGCQKVILTHDLGFYREVRRQVAGDCHAWTIGKMRMDANGPVWALDEDELVAARRLIDTGDHEQAATLLRRSAEDSLKRFRNYPDNGKFQSLSKHLKAAQHKLSEDALDTLAKFLDDPEIDETLLDILIPSSMQDIVQNGQLDQTATNRCCGRRQALKELLLYFRSNRRRAAIVLDEIEKVKDRILNPGAHADSPPLYRAEVEQALEHVREIRTLLASCAEED